MVVNFLRKNRATPSVITPGDTNPSDATDINRKLISTSSVKLSINQTMKTTVNISTVDVLSQSF